MNSRAKGKRGEVEAALLLTQLGLRARRAVEFCCFDGEGDLITNVDGVHFEVKFSERLNPYAYMQQAKRDSEAKQRRQRRSVKPCVMMRSSHRKWLVCIEANDLWEVIDAFIQARTTVQQADA